MILLWLAIYLELCNIQANNNTILEKGQNGSDYHPKFLHLGFPQKWKDWLVNLTILPWHRNGKVPEQVRAENSEINEEDLDIYRRLARMREEISKYEKGTFSSGDIFKMTKLLEKFVKMLERAYNDFLKSVELKGDSALAEYIVFFVFIIGCCISVLCFLLCNDKAKQTVTDWVVVPGKPGPLQTKQCSCPRNEDLPSIPHDLRDVSPESWPSSELHQQKVTKSAYVSRDNNLGKPFDISIA